MELLLAGLAAYGLCFGFQNKIPFIHNLSEFTDKLLACSYCTGFWCGWITYGLFTLPTLGRSYYISQAPSVWEYLVYGLVYAFASAALCYVMDTLVQYLEANTQWGNDQEEAEEEEG